MCADNPTTPQDPVKTASDKIDWKIVEQLHDATLKISNDCFEYKKLCVAVVAGVIALMVRFGSNENFDLVFAVCGLTSIGFWFCDATAYYYQRSLRKKMTDKINNIASRNSVAKEPEINTPNLFSSLFNKSMSLYWVLVLVITFLWCNF